MKVTGQNLADGTLILSFEDKKSGKATSIALEGDKIRGAFKLQKVMIQLEKRITAARRAL